MILFFNIFQGRDYQKTNGDIQHGVLKSPSIFLQLSFFKMFPGYSLGAHSVAVIPLTFQQ